jgi:hypothetical protein
LLIPSNKLEEQCIKIKLCDELNGSPEIITQYGILDILTKNRIIVVQKYKYFKHALGQILAHAIDYPAKRKCIYLYDIPVDADIVKVQKLYSFYNVELHIIE